MSLYDEGYNLGQVHAQPDSHLDPRWTMAEHARKGTLDEFMRGFNDGYEGKDSRQIRFRPQVETFLDNVMPTIED